MPAEKTPIPKYKVCMGGTLTFNSNLTYRQKKNRIKTIVPKFTENVCLFRRYYMEWMIEYHKVDGEDDLEAPHVHFMLWIERPFNDRDYRAVLAYLRQQYGKSQFLVMTGKKSQSYYKYMQKDREKYPDNYFTYDSINDEDPCMREDVLQALRDEGLINECV